MVGGAGAGPGAGAGAGEKLSTPNKLLSWSFRFDEVPVAVGAGGNGLKTPLVVGDDDCEGVWTGTGNNGTFVLAFAAVKSKS